MKSAAASFTVYRDVEHEVWTASGYATGSMPGEYVFTLQNPVSIIRMDRDGRTIDTIQAVRVPGAGVPALAARAVAVPRRVNSWKARSDSRPATASRNPRMCAGRTTSITTRMTWSPRAVLEHSGRRAGDAGG